MSRPSWLIEACQLGRVEYDGARYCHEHAGFLEPGIQSLRCDRAADLDNEPEPGE